MSKYDDAIRILVERFSKDSLIALATTDGKEIHNRIVDAYYDDGAFIIATYSLSNKAVQIASHPQVAIAAVDWFTAKGIGTNRGWVLDPKNTEIREKIRQAFCWYDEVTNEQDANNCFLEIRLTSGLLIKDHHAIRYQIDFINKTALLSENWGEFK